MIVLLFLQLTIFIFEIKVSASAEIAYHTNLHKQLQRDSTMKKYLMVTASLLAMSAVPAMAQSVDVGSYGSVKIDIPGGPSINVDGADVSVETEGTTVDVDAEGTEVEAGGTVVEIESGEGVSGTEGVEVETSDDVSVTTEDATVIIENEDQ